MFIKAFFFSLFVMEMIFFYFPQTVTSLECYKCTGAKKEPFEDTGCNKTHNCTGALNNCMIRITRNKISAPETFTLECRAEVDCTRMGVGCKNHSSSIICTKCCTSDLCNLPTSFEVTSTTAPPSTPTSAADRIQVLPSTLFLAILAVFWF